MKLIDILVRELPKRGGWPIESNGCRQFPDGEVCFSNVGKKPDFYTECATDVDLVWIETVTHHVSREQYEAALAAKNEGWIKWGGGECPVADFLKVEYQLRGGAKGSEYAKILEWQHEGGRHDIIAYRLHKPKEAEQAKADDEADLNECICQDVAPVWSGEGLPPVGMKVEWLSDKYGWLGVTVAAHDAKYPLIAIIRHNDGYTGCHRHEIRTEAERKREAARNGIYAAMDIVDGDIADAIYDAIAAGKITGVKLED